MILLLGGTAEARELAVLLQERGHHFISSLAGRVVRPRLPTGQVRIGGFGGVPGLRDYLRNERVTAVVDATHPFAQGMSANAVAACSAEPLPLLRLERPGWANAAGSGEWHWVADHDEAASTAAGLGGRPFLTIGRQPLARFTGPLAEHDALVRVVDTPDIQLPTRWRVLLSRGPYPADAERALLGENRTDVLVTKDSGGSYTWGKIEAAAALRIPVVMVRRGPAPGAVSVVNDARTAAAWADALP